MPFLKKINWQYAIGEVLIVILGISIAFSLNNWSTNRKEQKQKIKYLKSLKLDLKSDILQLDSNIIKLQQRNQNINQIRKYIGIPNARKDTLLPKIYNLPLPIDFRPRNITFKTLINSGDLKLINDYELKAAIQEHYLSYEYILEEYQRQNILVEKYVGDFFMNQLDYNVIYRNRDFSFMETTFFGNMIGALFSTFDIKIKASKRGQSSCRELIKLIDADI